MSDARMMLQSSKKIRPENHTQSPQCVHVQNATRIVKLFKWTLRLFTKYCSNVVSIFYELISMSRDMKSAILWLVMIPVCNGRFWLIKNYLKENRFIWQMNPSEVCNSYTRVPYLCEIYVKLSISGIGIFRDVGILKVDYLSWILI